MTFSIITPSFRQLDWLRLCIASVRDQIPADSSFTIEHIIQDAGSDGIEDFAHEVRADFYRNGTLVFEGGKRIESEVASDQAEQQAPSARPHRRSPQPDTRNPLPVTPHSGYRLAVHCERDAGMYDAVNRGIQKSKGDILAYINCDEQYLPGALARVIETFDSQPDAEILSAGCLVIDPNGNLITARPGLVPWYGHVLTDHLPIFTASLFYRKSVVSERWHLFDTRYKDVADAIWVLARLQEKRKFAASLFFTTAFTDTGENMNLLPNARNEARYLRGLVPFRYSLFRKVFVAAHRIKKFFLGCYRKKNYNYQIFTAASPGKRINFTSTTQAGIWEARLHLLDEERKR